jgi:pimeloyl-ACP methyl ester carboxylesterase
MGRDLAHFRRAEQRVWDEVGISPEERHITLRTGESLRVQESGAGAPVLFVHGASNAGTSWSRLIAGLQRFRCIALDRPGCGLSEPMRAAASLRDASAFETFASAIVADVLDALELDTAHVVATSFGGYFTFRSAAAHPERFERIVELGWSVGAPMATTPFAMRITALPGIGAAMTRIPPTRSAVRAVLRQVGLAGALESGQFTDTMLDWFHAVLRDTDTMRNELAATPRLITPWRGQNERMLIRGDVRARVTNPVLFVWGTDDPNGGEEIGRRFAEPFPDVTFEVLHDVGHAPWIDEPEHCAALTSAFLTA